MITKNPIIRRVLTVLACVAGAVVAPFNFKREDNAGSRCYGNIRRKVIAGFVCGIFAALVPVENAAAVGAAVEVGLPSGDTGAGRTDDLGNAPHFAVSGYPTETAAMDALLVLLSTNMDLECDVKINVGRIENGGNGCPFAMNASVTFFTNSVYVWNTEQSEIYGAGVDRPAARLSLEVNCMVPLGSDCAISYGAYGTFRSSHRECGDGTQLRDTDQCNDFNGETGTAIIAADCFTVVSGEAVTNFFDGMVCVETCPAGVAADLITCLPSVVATDCTDPNLMLFNGMACVGTCPTDKLRIVGNTCFPPQVVGDCNGVTPFLNDIACVEMCPADSPGVAADGKTCLTPVVATDCTTANLMFFNGAVCVMACLAPKPETETDGITCRVQTKDDCTTSGAPVFDGIACMATCPADKPEMAADGVTCIALVVPQKSNDVVARAVVGGGVLFFIAAHYFGGAEGEFSFSPDYGYAASESGYSYRYGGRINYKNARWNAYWTAAQANVNGNTGDLRYGSGGSYKADFWQVAFSESISGQTINYNFALSADYNGGIWKLSPVYRMRSRLEEDGESKTDNALNVEAILNWNRWTVRPSAGFRWENTENFGDQARFGVRAVRRF